MPDLDERKNQVRQDSAAVAEEFDRLRHTGILAGELHAPSRYRRVVCVDGVSHAGFDHLNAGDEIVFHELRHNFRPIPLVHAASLGVPIRELRGFAFLHAVVQVRDDLRHHHEHIVLSHLSLPTRKESIQHAA